MEKTKSIAEDISIIMSIERTEEYFKNIENNDWFICGMLLDRCKELVKKSGLDTYKKIILNFKIESIQKKYNGYLVKNNDKINKEFEKVIKEIAGCDIDA
jgi:hypothetical protein|nr:MAG TPA: hypothetical protein [Caudoviricetes sp.]DAS25098.1 MAG TPA: hypothetical protein [Caudoviricetes sp.]